MCKDFECVHDHCWMCSITDEECEEKLCGSWGDCSNCTSNSLCNPIGDQVDVTGLSRG